MYMKKILKSALLIVLFFGCHSLNAQVKEYKDKIFLQQGSVIVGAITDYVPGEKLSIELKTGNSLTFTDKQVKRIVMYQGSGDAGVKPIVPIREKRIFNETDFSFLAGPSFLGFSLSHNFMFQHNQRLSYGAGLGIDNYKMEPGKSIFPLYANAKYNLIEGNSAPYLGMKLGYGLAFTNEEANITEAQGGYMFSPYFGIRIGSRKTIFNLFSGLKIQKADYVISRSWETRTEDILYRRVMLGMSVMF